MSTTEGDASMATFFEGESHTFSEYLLVPGYSSHENVPANVSLETPWSSSGAARSRPSG